MVFLKQYGERRTGTNYLRALLKANYSNVVPLMHVMGDKHSPPVALDELWEKVRDEPDAAWRLITESTFTAPADTTSREDPRQLAYMRELAEPAADAVASGRLVFALSTKHPFPWVVSAARFQGWLVMTTGGLRLHPRLTGRVIEACRAYNLRHESWLDHVSRYGSRSIIVRHEDLLADSFSVLRTLASRFELKQAAPELTDLVLSAAAPIWDEHPLTFRQRPFDREYYRQRDYIRCLNSDLWEIVKRLIDWRLMSHLGYSADGSTSTDWSFTSLCGADGVCSGAPDRT